VLRSQTQANLDKVNNQASSELSRMLIEDMKRTDHLIYVDTALSLTAQEHDAVKNQ